MIGDRWNVTDDEVARHYPCDDFVPKPTLQAWRGVTVQTTPETLWRWVSQIRIAPYSYDWIDNLGRRSPQPARRPTRARRRRIVFHCGDPTVRTHPCRPVPEHLTGEIMGTCISYVLVPAGQSTRLLMKLVTAMSRWLTPGLSVGDLVMARRQLLNLKRLAERH